MICALADRQGHIIMGPLFIFKRIFSFRYLKGTSQVDLQSKYEWQYNL